MSVDLEKTELLAQAVALHQAGRSNEAEAVYRALLSHDPDQPDAVALLGVLCAQSGRGDEALLLAKRAVALDPSSALFQFYLGNAHFSVGDRAKAMDAYRAAVKLEPRAGEAWYNLGNLLQEEGLLDEAEKAYLETLHLRPLHLLARNNLALVYEKKGLLSEALLEIKKVVKADPTFSDGWRNLCTLAERNGDYALAEEAGLSGTQVKPDDAALWFGLGVAQNRLEKNEEAIVSYQKALALAPRWGDVWDNLGQSFQFLNRLDEAEEAYRRRIELAGQGLRDEALFSCDEAEIGNHHWHLALLELLKGNLRLGFARYRARFSEVAGIKRPAWGQPVWLGETLAGKTILVHDEQGFGDTLMMARFLPLLKARGAARVWFLVGKALVPLFQGWDGVDRLISRGEALPLGFDVYASVFDLPFVFATTRKGIPFAEGYLPGRSEAKPPAQPLRVGIVWAGAPAHKHDARRSVPLAEFAPFFSIPNLVFTSLTRDKRVGDDEILRRFQIEDASPRCADFGVAARLMEGLDLVITCDTSTAHLAGGLGKKVWILLPFAPDWRWGLAGDTTPWYASARLFRQERCGDWAGVIAQVREALIALTYSLSKTR